MTGHVLVIDQGTTSTRSIVFDAAAFARRWTAERRFRPSMETGERARKYAGWQRAVARTLLRP